MLTKPRVDLHMRAYTVGALPLSQSPGVEINEAWTPNSQMQVSVMNPSTAVPVLLFLPTLTSQNVKL